jgi:hypothetical protein
LYKEDPRGLFSNAYEVSDPKVARMIEDAAWKVVNTNELAGVARLKTNP